MGLGVQLGAQRERGGGCCTVVFIGGVEVMNGYYDYGGLYCAHPIIPIPIKNSDKLIIQDL